MKMLAQELSIVQLGEGEENDNAYIGTNVHRHEVSDHLLGYILWERVLFIKLTVTVRRP